MKECHKNLDSQNVEELVKRAHDYMIKRLKELEKLLATNPPTDVSPRPYIPETSKPIPPLTPMSKAARKLVQIKKTTNYQENALPSLPENKRR